jgi:predicted GIY-YIG superfamily endonuclease
MDLRHIPRACGVYLMRDATGVILYIGKANDLAKRVAQYFNPSRDDLKNSVLVPLIREIDYIPCASERDALLLERLLVRRLLWALPQVLPGQEPPALPVAPALLPLEALPMGVQPREALGPAEDQVLPLLPHRGMPRPLRRARLLR